MPATDTYLCLVCLQQLHLSEVVTHWQTVHQDEHAPALTSQGGRTEAGDASEGQDHTTHGSR